MKNRFVIFLYLKHIFMAMGGLIFFLILLTFLLVGRSSTKVAQGEVKNNISKENVEEIKKMKIEDINFDSNIKVYVTKEDKVVEMGLEEYIVGVVSAEMPASFEAAALESQAIAARTYTLGKLEATGGHKCSQGKGADLCDTVHCQAYINKEKRFANWEEGKKDEYWKKVNDAVNNTKGKVLTYEGELIKAFYFSTSSGNTENCEEVFSQSLPYLRSVESKGEDVAPKYKSDFTFTENDIINKIKATNGDFAVNDMEQEIKIVSRTEGGSVKEIQIGNKTFKGTEIRKILDLSSANFDVEFHKGIVTFKCTGYGHGVGLSQWGANIMGKEGKNYEDILKHYYTGVTITELKYKN